MPVAGPLIMAGGAIGGSLLSRGGGNKALEQEQLGLARQQGQFGKMATPLLQQSSDYYLRLLRGDRAAMTSALSPEISSITQLYSGAGKNLDKSAAGPSKDLAKSELNRSRVGDLGKLFLGARQGAAQSASQLGGSLAGAGSGASGIYSSILNGRRDDRRQNFEEGSSIGPLLVDLYKAWQMKGASGGSAQGGGIG